MKVRRWLMERLDGLDSIIDSVRKKYDICEVCREEKAETTCSEGCQKRICEECRSYFYSDATICAECRAAITPEEEAQIRAECAAYEEEDFASA